MPSQSEDSAELLHAESECGVEIRNDLTKTIQNKCIDLYDWIFQLCVPESHQLIGLGTAAGLQLLHLPTFVLAPLGVAAAEIAETI